jgi:SulP family sulfate permease
MAFAIASGAPPQTGIVTASSRASSSASLGGRTLHRRSDGAFVVILAGIGAAHGWNDLMLCTMLRRFPACPRVTGLGKIIIHPVPVTMGFTSGIAVLIMSTQVKDFFGLPVASVPSNSLKRPLPSQGHAELSLSATVLSITTSFSSALAQGAGAPRAGTIVAIIAGRSSPITSTCPWRRSAALRRHPAGLSAPSLPTIDWANLLRWWQPAITIALLAAIESLLCAVVADGMTDAITTRQNSSHRVLRTSPARSSRHCCD